VLDGDPPPHGKVYSSPVPPTFRPTALARIPQARILTIICIVD